MSVWIIYRFRRHSFMHMQECLLFHSGFVCYMKCQFYYKIQCSSGCERMLSFFASLKSSTNQPMIACASVDSFYIQTINKDKVQDKTGADHTAHEQVVDPFGVLASKQFDDVQKAREHHGNIEFDENGARRKKTQYQAKPRISKDSSMSIKSTTHFANAHKSTLMLLIVAV